MKKELYSKILKRINQVDRKVNRKMITRIVLGLKSKIVIMFTLLIFCSMLLPGCRQRELAKDTITEKNRIEDDITENNITNNNAENNITEDNHAQEWTDADKSNYGEIDYSGKLPNLDALLSTCTYITKEMYEKATAFKEGDLTRIAAAMRKAKAGEKVTIGVIGGSITEGYSASQKSNCYASLLKQWWVDTFPEAEIELINAGVGGTGSYLGVHRVDEDLLSHKPDFVVVEFAVNDGNSFFYKKSYDNLVRRILQQENEPALALLFMTMEDGTSAQDLEANIGFQYGLPMISYGNGVLQEMKNNNLAWKDISPDNIHPNDRGHGIVGELFTVYLTQIYHRLDTIPKEVTPFKMAAVTKEVYTKAEILDSKEIKPAKWGSFYKDDVNTVFPNNWSTESGEEGIEFIVEAANIGIMYQKLTNGTGGQYEVYVDGEYAMTLDADFSNGWGDFSETTEVFVSEDRKMRTIEIRKKGSSTEENFTILGLLIS